MIHLDTNFLIAALEPGTQQAERLEDWLTTGQTVRFSIIVWAEFLCGPVKAEHLDVARSLAKELIPLLPSDAERSAALFNAGGRRRGSLADCLIAATCIRLNAELATKNTDDFARFEPMGLRLVR